MTGSTVCVWYDCYGDMYYGHSFYLWDVAGESFVFILTTFSIHCRFVVQLDDSEAFRVETTVTFIRRGLALIGC